jgi:hypothetical protein
VKKDLLLWVILMLIFLPGCSAAHYIIGTVEDAKDSTLANEHTIILWNPIVGIQDNLSDIIGPTGNSEQNNNYSIDCELLNTPCSEGDTLSLKVIDKGDNYVSEEKNVTVTTNPEDYVENITLNSPPTTNLIFPSDFANISNSQVNFNCSSSDLDNNLEEISLYGNWTGEWVLNETKDITSSEGFKIFTKDFSQGFYKYACKVTDNLSISSFSSQNNSFTVDLTKPEIESVLGNFSSSCDASPTVRINCTTQDQLLKIDNVIIQALSPSQIINYSASLLTGNTYYSDIPVNETGTWMFNCISNDSAGNINNLTSEEFQINSGTPELFINFTSITLNESNPFENQIVKINAIVENLGCTNAENVLVSFFEGDPDISGENIRNVTINISQISSTPANISWNAKIGPNNIFVVADYNNLIDEENESNNKANKTLSINSWQYIYGNASVDKIIGDETENISKWFNESNLQGNIFITDSESSINWLSLQAIGKTKTGGESFNDFLEIDEILGMTYFEDPISEVFSENQNPKSTTNMLVHQKEILGVPIVNSTNNSSFVTGILWDSSDDILDGEFDSEDKEDIVFITPIKKNTEGSYGFYDYEIIIPSKLREYESLDSEKIYLYYDLN